MIDAALIQQCADPTLNPAIVERFIAEAGSTDPLAVTVRSGDRIVLIPKSVTPDEAMALVREFVGKAVVPVGISQYPTGLGVSDVSVLDPIWSTPARTSVWARCCSPRSTASSQMVWRRR